MAGNLYSFGADQETHIGAAAGGELLSAGGKLLSDCEEGCCDHENPCYIVACNTGEFPCPCSDTDNLLTNPSAETGDVTGWTNVVGTWSAQDENLNPATVPVPFDGTWFFFAGTSASAELRQDVDVSAYANRIDEAQYNGFAEGYTSSDTATPQDTSRIVVEYRDAGGNVLDSWDTGNVSSSKAWVQRTDTRAVPVGTRTVRYRLISTRNFGTNNDGYYDALVFKMICAASYNRCDFDCCWTVRETGADATISDATLGGDSSAISFECDPDESSSTYTFASTFTINNCNLDTLQLPIRFQVRDSVDEVRVNGNVVAGLTGNTNRPGDVTWHTGTLTLANAGLVAGANTIQVDVSPGGGADGPELRWEWLPKVGG